MPDSTSSLINKAQISYKYLPLMQTIAQTSFVESNIVLVSLTAPSLSKSVSPINVRIGEVLTYTNIFTFPNSGTTITNIVLQDTTPANTAFVPNSLVINGTTIPGASLNPPGYTLAASIIVPTVFTVNFNVTANTVAQPTTVSNSSTVMYFFNNGVTTDTVSLNATSVDATINPFTPPASASMIKSVNKSIATIEETLTYSIAINNGELTADNVLFIDTIPSSTTFVENSFVVGNTTLPGANPGWGIPIGPLGANSVTTLSFQVLIDTVPSQNPILNSATALLVYSVTNPNDTLLGINSSVVKTTVNHGSLVGTKLANTGYANIGDTITYTIAFKNIGNLNAENVFVTDNIPLGTVFIPGSVSINGITSVNANPQSPGIILGTIAPNTASTLTFAVIIAPTVPYPKVISNSAQASYSFVPFPVTPPIGESIMYALAATGTTVYTQAVSSTAVVTISSVALNTSKSVDKTSASLGDILTYTILITNPGTTSTTNLQFSDKISSSLAIVPKSFKQDGILKAGSLVSPGLTLDNISPNTTSTITFKAKIIKTPNSGKIDNYATLNYSYTVNPNSSPISSTTNTNTVSTSVNMANLSSIRKRVDKTDAKINDILTYTISMTNTGTLSAHNVILNDKLSRGGEFVQGSLKIDGICITNLDPTSDCINLGSISPNQKIIITFKVKVLALIPPPCEIANIAKVDYEYNSGKCYRIKAYATSNAAVTELASTQLRYKKRNC